MSNTDRYQPLRPGVVLDTELQQELDPDAVLRLLNRGAHHGPRVQRFQQRWEGAWGSGDMTAGQAAYEVERLGFCGCGSPTGALQIVANVLDTYHSPTGQHLGCWDELKVLTPNEGILYVLLYLIDSTGLADHGISVPGWLTPRGVAFRDALHRFSIDTIAEGALDYDTGELC